MTTRGEANKTMHFTAPTPGGRRPRVASPTVRRGLSVLCLVACAGACKNDSPPTPATKHARKTAPEEQPVAELEVSNPSDFERRDEPVYSSYYRLGLQAQDPRIARLVARSDGTVLPSQHVDRDANGQPDGLLTLVNLDARASKRLQIVAATKRPETPSKRVHAEISVKRGGKWQPREKDPSLQEIVGGQFESVRSFSPPAEHTDHSQLIRYEGPGIESDRVGYRVYLDPRNGFDVFGKKTPEPVLERIGLDGYESYHEMSDWGMDILKVGLSLGAGGFGFYDGKKVQLVSELEGWDVEVTDTGPIYASFSTTYRKWRVNGQTVDLRATLSMHAGSRRVETRLELSEPLDNLAIGVVRHEGTQLLQASSDVTGRAHVYAASWGKQSLSGDHLGLAVLFPRGTREAQLSDGASYVSVMKPSGTSFAYHFLAAWQGEKAGVQSAEEFEALLKRETERLTMPLRIRLETTYSNAAKGPITKASALAWAQKLADSELARKTLRYRYGGWDENRGRQPKFEYDVVGLQPLAYERLARLTRNPSYDRVLEEVTGSYVTDAGEIRAYDQSSYNIDSVAPGRNLLMLYEATKQEKYAKAAGTLREQLEHHPRTSEGAFWHKKRYPHQLWLDGVYMGMPFLARYSNLFEKGAGLKDVTNEFIVTRRHLRDPETGLYYHAWDEKRSQPWADPETGRSGFFWARGLGWFSMALVDVLDEIPESSPELRRPLLDMVAELAEPLLAHRDPDTKTWWQILDRPGAVGNYRESSASAMFAYFFAKAVRKGYLPAKYRKAAVESFEGLVREFVTVHPDGKISMESQCLVAGLGYGRDGSYRYYMSEPVWSNDPKGNGPFMLAGAELHELL